MENLIFSSIRKLIHAISTKKISVQELIIAHVQYIKSINPKLNALLQFDENRLIKKAKEYDKLLAENKCKGPLHGIPISIKDNIATKDYPSSIGVKKLKNNIPPEDATVVKRLKQAGAIILGKTNMPDFAMGWDTKSSAIGITNNPYDLTRSSGGSSGGEAALIAAGGSPLGIGNDGGGSIRIPAHYCGVVGFRPSIEAIPSTGLLPPESGGYAVGFLARLFTMGPIARYVDDISFIMPILAGTDYQDPTTSIYPYPLNTQHIDFTKLRIGFCITDKINEPTVDIQNTILQTAKIIEKKCLAIKEITPPGLQNSWNIFCKLCACDGAEGFKQYLKHLGITHPSQNVQYILDRFEKQTLSLNKFLSLWTEWDFYRSKLLQFMLDYDVLITPVLPNTAPLHSDILSAPGKDLSVLNYVAAFSLVGWPCVIVRAGTTSEGLPIGVQITTKYWHDHIALAIAKYIENELGGWQKPKNLLP